VHPKSNVQELFSGEYFFHDWYADKYCQGAFALYGPSQFAELYPHVVQPAAEGLLHFAGEATSVHHAWIIGSLNSAYRTVYEILDYERLESLKIKLVEQWGIVDEVEYGDFDYIPYTLAATKSSNAIQATQGVEEEVILSRATITTGLKPNFSKKKHGLDSDSKGLNVEKKMKVVSQVAEFRPNINQRKHLNKRG